MQLFVCFVVALASIVPGTLGSVRVAQGREAVPHSRPWQVAIYDRAWQFLARQYCGGALVGKEWVLTAAHCIMGSMHAGLGYHHKYADHDATGTQYIEGVEYRSHPGFSSLTLENDIALIKLEIPAVLNNNVSVISISKAPPVDGEKLILTGWGTKSKFGWISSRVLREVELTTLNDTACQAAYPGLSVSNSVFCTETADGSSGGCQGDSGGPLVSNYDESRDSTSRHDGKEPLLQGIFSWNVGCGISRYPDVSMKLSEYCDWISKETGNEVTCV